MPPLSVIKTPNRGRSLTPVILNDTYWANVAVLMHMEGTNGSTIFTDAKGNTVDRHVYDGPMDIRTSQKKFGNSSGYFTQPPVGVVGNCLSITTNNTSYFGGGNNPLTFEMWVYPLGWPTKKALLSFDETTSGASSWGLYCDGTNISIEGNAAIGGSVGAGNMAINSWTHVAVTRNQYMGYIWVNGSLRGSGAWSSVMNRSSATGICIGNRRYNVNQFESNTNFYGYIDEFRITNGVARYTSNFSVPTTQFPEQ